MKLLCLLLVCFFSFSIFVPSLSKEMLKKLKIDTAKTDPQPDADNTDNADAPEATVTNVIVIPDGMKHIGAPGETLTFPDPKKTAVKMFGFFYDCEIYKCQLGADMANAIKKLVMDFMGSYKPPSEITPAQAVASVKRQGLTLETIRDLFEKVSQSKCAAFLQAEARRFRRHVFLLSLRPLLSLKFLKTTHNLVVQDTLGEQTRKEAEKESKKKHRKNKKH